jgi:exopolyphosphatase/guanosine-5'-triphosphate,3'-diphosphate pyrophosphatase
MPGFSRLDQARLAALLLGHAGKLGKLAVSSAYIDWRMLFSIRLAHLICRRRADEKVPDIHVQEVDGGFSVTIPKSWAQKNPLTVYSLEKESNDWQKIDKRYQIEMS